MAKIDKEGLEQLKIARNALDTMYDKLESKGVFDGLSEEFNFISEVISNAATEWKVVEDGNETPVATVIVNGQVYEQVK